MILKSGRIIYNSITSFVNDRCFQYSAAVSFYTLFSIAPIVSIMIYIGSIFADDVVITEELQFYLEQFLSKESVEGVMVLVSNLQRDGQNIISLIVGIVILIFSATNLFIQFKEAFNDIFRVKAKEGQGFIKAIVDRSISFGMIVFLGVGLIISLIIDSVLLSFFDFFAAYFDSSNVVVAGIGGNIVTLTIVFFAVLSMFYFLPDVAIKRRILIVGSAITAFLLFLGKFIVGWIIANSSFNELSGASASVIILMLWIYYSSMILFYGVEMIKAMADAAGGGIKANKYSTRIKLVQVEKGKGDITNPEV